MAKYNPKTQKDNIKYNHFFVTDKMIQIKIMNNTLNTLTKIK